MITARLVVRRRQHVSSDHQITGMTAHRHTQFDSQLQNPLLQYHNVNNVQLYGQGGTAQLGCSHSTVCTSHFGLLVCSTCGVVLNGFPIDQRLNNNLTPAKMHHSNSIQSQMRSWPCSCGARHRSEAAAKLCTLKRMRRIADPVLPLKRKYSDHTAPNISSTPGRVIEGLHPVVAAISDGAVPVNIIKKCDSIFRDCINSEQLSVWMKTKKSSVLNGIRGRALAYACLQYVITAEVESDPSDGGKRELLAIFDVTCPAQLQARIHKTLFFVMMCCKRSNVL